MRSTDEPDPPTRTLHEASRRKRKRSQHGSVDGDTPPFSRITFCRHLRRTGVSASKANELYDAVVQVAREQVPPVVSSACSAQPTAVNAMTETEDANF